MSVDIDVREQGMDVFTGGSCLDSHSDEIHLQSFNEML